MILKPSHHIKAALSGAASYYELDDACKSAIRMQLYLISCDILSKRQNERIEIIEAYNAELQPLIKAEITRLFNLRRK